ncbi:MAG: hypothetical protein KatS3mg102_2490 [Planctomycetota bacterium]|nr:MAG: hypothetical protein KatS3mg102_2490 [Planctomycetota bacterium]
MGRRVRVDGRALRAGARRRGVLGALLVLAALLAPSGGASGAAWAEEAGASGPAVPAARFEDRFLDRVAEYRLDNGLVLLVLERHEVPVFSAVTMVHVGSVDEHVGITGVAHVFEHLAFKGSRAIGTTDYEGEQRALAQLDAKFDELLRERSRPGGPDPERLRRLEQEFERLQRAAAAFVINNEYSVIVERNGGAGLNASTGADTTQYFVSFPSNKLELWFLLEAERFREPVLREFYKEKEVVREERRLRTESNPIGMLIEEFQAVAFKAHPYGQPVIGHDSDLVALRRAQAEAFFRRYYVPNNMVVAIVGDVRAERCRELAERYFGPLARGPEREPVHTVEPPQQGERRVEVVLPAQPLVGIGWHRPGIAHPDDPVYDVMAAVLAQGRASRLYERLVKRERVALQAGAFNGFPGQQYPHLFVLYAVPAIGHEAAELERKLLEEAERLVREPVQAEELARARSMLRAAFIRGLASNQGLAMALASAQTLTGDWREAFRALRRMEAVSAADIQRVARATFRRTNRVVGSLLPPGAAQEGGASQGGEEAGGQQRGGAATPGGGGGAGGPGGAPAGGGDGEQAAGPAGPAGRSTRRRRLPHEQLELPPLRPYRPPQPRRVALQGGGKLLLLEDRELPLIDLVVMVRGGRRLESRDKAGLASMWAEVLRAGGSRTLDGDRLDALLESRGAAIEVAAEEDRVVFRVSALREDFPELLGLLRDLLLEPAFPEDKLELVRKQHLSAIARRNDEPGGIAERELRRALYGDDTPYGWTEEPATVRAVSRADLVAFHRRALAHPPLAGVVGDFEDDAAVAEMVQRALAAIGGEPGRPIPDFQLAQPAPRVLLARKPELNQSTIAMGHLAPRRSADDPDYCAAVVANAILGGGGFSSRLLQRVRTEMGLAYAVYSYFEAPYHRPGAFRLSCQTKSGSTLEAIRALLAEVERLRTEPPNAEELAIAKDSILQQLIFASESRADVLDRALRYEFYGFPADYLERFQRGVAAVGAGDVQRVAQQRMRPEELWIVVVGNDAAFDGDLAELGRPVQPIELEASDRPAAAVGSAAAATPEAIARGREIIAQALRARGGRERLEALRSLRLRGTGTLHTAQGAVPVATTVTLVFPDRVRIELKSPLFGELLQVCDGKHAWMRTAGGVVELPASQARQLREQAAGDGSQLLRRLAEPDAQPVFLGTEELDGRSVVVIDAGGGTKLFFDAESHALVRRDEERPEGVVTTWMDEYREVAGLQFARRVRTFAGGEERVRVEFEQVEVNPEVPEAAFQRPPATEPAAQPGAEGEGSGRRAERGQAREREPAGAAAGGSQN